MTKKINLGKVVFWAFILMTIVLACISCNPVKRVLQDEAKKRQVWEAGVLQDWCTNDSVFVSDTTVLFDTLHLLETAVDTVVRDSVTYINTVSYKTVTKTVTIRDTTIVTDRAKENILQKQIAAKDGQINELRAKAKEWEDRAVKERKRGNKAYLFLWLVIAGLTLYVLRKPLSRIISPIKLPM